MVVCPEQGADLHMGQLMPLPLTVSCFSKIQIGFTFLVSAHLGSPGKMAVKWVCLCVCGAKVSGICGGGQIIWGSFLSCDWSDSAPQIRVRVRVVLCIVCPAPEITPTPTLCLPASTVSK